MRSDRFLISPQLAQRGASTLRNVVLGPASLLAFKANWQSVAYSLQEGGVLVVLPGASRQRAILEQVAAELRKIGRNVRTVSVEAHELVEER